MQTCSRKFISQRLPSTSVLWRRFCHSKSLLCSIINLSVLGPPFASARLAKVVYVKNMGVSVLELKRF